jgi:hypothetical protein
MISRKGRKEKKTRKGRKGSYTLLKALLPLRE